MTPQTSRSIVSVKENTLTSRRRNLKAMHRKVSRTAIIFIFAAIIFGMYQEMPAQKKKSKKAPAAKQVKPAAPEISYTVSMSKPATHLLEVEMHVKWQSMPAQIELKMPVWTPGSYLIREYARHVQEFAAAGASGSKLNWRKVNKNTWQIDTGGASEITARYKVYANELTVRTNELNSDHAFWNNGATLMFVKGGLRVPSTVAVKPFGSWKVATGLPPVAGAENTFRASDYDVLYDSPFEVSDFREVNFTVEGKPHRVVFSGDGNYDMKQTAADITKIVEQAYKIFGELPYDDYTFIVNLRGGGGLEHLNSTALQTNRFAFKPAARYKGFLGLVAHEYFHCFNVKRIRPDVLGPFDYENENYTTLLWMAEGGTEYYSNLLLVRAGLITDKEYLAQISSAIQQLQNRPGRFETSLEQASFDAWIKYYRQDENSINNQVSYYDKGELITMMLDLAIREASDGAKSLDDVMRYLYAEFYKKGKNYSRADLQKIAETMAGKSLDDFFTKYVGGTEDVDWQSFFGPLGLTVNVTLPNTGKAYIGADMAEEGGRLTIRSIPAGTPAYDQGLNTGDQIVAVDGYRASQAFLQSYVAERKPGDKVRFTIFRFDVMRDMEFTLGSNDRREYSIQKVAAPVDAQRRLYKQYLNAEF